MSNSLSKKCSECSKMLHQPAMNVYGMICPRCWYQNIYRINNEIDDCKRYIREITKQEKTMKQWLKDKQIPIERDTNAYQSLEYVVKQTNFEDFRFLHQRGLCYLKAEGCMICVQTECEKCRAQIPACVSMNQCCKSCLQQHIVELETLREKTVNNLLQVRKEARNTKFM